MCQIPDLPQIAALEDASDLSQGDGRQPVHFRERDACSPVRSIPQRSLSSPDMSRFKFRLCLSKPPIHPTSSGKIRRQLSLEETSIDDDGALAKSTSDRHCEQERLFHQLDQQLTLGLPNAAAAPPLGMQRSGPFPVPLVARQPTGAFQPAALSGSPHWPATMLSPSEAQSRLVSGQTTATIAGSMAGTAEHEDMLHESNSDGDVCQPSTPIRREDSIPLREDNQSLLGEAMFAAMYEQTNILLRNLHFERMNRRVSTA